MTKSKLDKTLADIYIVDTQPEVIAIKMSWPRMIREKLRDRKWLKKDT